MALGLGHLPVLDGVRGLAVFLLLMHQFVLPSSLTSVPGRLFERTLQVGWIGVQLFFVLSGFLITSVLIEARHANGSVMAFYGRRVLRIFPLYYLLLAAAVLLPYVTQVPPLLRGEPGQMTLNWVYLSNWRLSGPTVLGHTWSLAVEEQFYLVWPFVVRAFAGRRLLRACLTLAAVSLLLRIVLRAWGADPQLVYQNTFTRMDALALGAAGAAAVRDNDLLKWLEPRLGKILAISSVTLAVVAARGLGRTTALTQTAGYSLLAIVFALVVLRAVLDQARGGGLVRFLSWAPLRSLGKYSYGIYILQLPLQIWVSTVLLPNLLAFKGDLRYVVVQAVYFAVMVVVAFGLAFALYHLYEKRFLALKRYLQL